MSRNFTQCECGYWMTDRQWPEDEQYHDRNHDVWLSKHPKQSDNLKVYTVELTELDLHWMSDLLYQKTGGNPTRWDDAQKKYMRLANKLQVVMGQPPFGEEYL